MFMAAEICGPGRLPYPRWACLLRETHDSSSINKADRQVVTDRHAEIHSVTRTTEGCSVVHPPTPHASPSQTIPCLIGFIYLTRACVAVYSVALQLRTCCVSRLLPRSALLVLTPAALRLFGACSRVVKPMSTAYIC